MFEKKDYIIGILVLLLILLGWKSYGLWQKSKQSEASLEHNKIAWSDSLRRVNGLYTQHVREYDLTDSLKTAKLGKDEERIAFLETETMRLRNQVGQVDTLWFHTTRDSAIHPVLRDTLANDLIALRDSLYIGVKSDSTGLSWRLDHQFGLSFTRDIQLKHYLTQNSSGLWSIYFKTVNPRDSALISFTSVDPYIDVEVFKHRTFWEKMYLSGGVGFRTLDGNLMLGVGLWSEDWHIGAMYYQSAVDKTIFVGYYNSIYNIFH